MPSESQLLSLPADSYLEAAFVRWVLAPAVAPAAKSRIVPQQSVEVCDRQYRVDYEVVGEIMRIAVELDGFEFHSSRNAFTYDRLRQNDLAAAGRTVIRFSYDAIRRETVRCVAQLQGVLSLDPLLRTLIIDDPVVATPDMDPNPLFALRPSTELKARMTYFEGVRNSINQGTLRACQTEAFAALGNYFLTAGGGRRA